MGLGCVGRRHCGRCMYLIVIHLFLIFYFSSISTRLTLPKCGGSSGHTCVSLAPICPQTKFIVQDMSADAMELGRENITFLSSSDSSSPYHDLNSRITFAIHDFFTEQKTLADVYIFRHILHDWDDGNSVKIIKALVPALEKKSAESNGRPPRVLISEGIVPPAPEKRRGTVTEKMIRWVLLSIPFLQVLCRSPPTFW